MTRLVVILAACLIAAIPSLALAQDKVFRAWFEAPQTVMAGETVQVWMWAIYEIDSVPETVGNMDAAVGSIEVSGDLAAFTSISQLRNGLALILDRGTPDGPWLRDFMTVQPHGPGINIDERNPIPMLMFEIETTPQTTGLLHVDLRPFTNESIPYLSWFYLDGPDHWTSTTDPDVSLITTTATIRIIPAPASAAMLAFGSLGFTRRRR
ncbi:MAG: hypothetical protein KF757_01085 [Phycisphaeraceae bacterium]|nr:hypothetical protein [Phycisphaeraceae bacterium]MCW5761802.1 hypothetical protein [Phycisphaeraceae bacterium]